MKKINGLSELKKAITENDRVWLLLYKQGSEQSDCAFANFSSTVNKSGDLLIVADVNNVWDIHSEYEITSVPSLLEFEKGKLKNVTKGCLKTEQFNAIIHKNILVLPSAGGQKNQKRVTVYTTPTCSWCTTIKRHLQANGIQYSEVNVAANQKAAEEMVKKSGQQGVPQTDIDGQIIVGFDKTRINALLGIR